MLQYDLFDGVYNGKKVFVTGNTGFKGSWLSLWLSELGADVMGYSISVPTEPGHFSSLKPKYKQAFADIRDAEKVCRAVQEFEPDIIFHLAAQPLVIPGYKKPAETIETNVMGTVNILDAALKTEAVQAVIIVTSDKCYKNNEWIWGYRENDPMGGKDPYSASKGSAELITNAYLQSYFNGDYSSKLLASVRAGNVIGGGDWADYRLIPDLIRSAVGGESIDIRSPGATRPWQHVIEALSGYLFLGEKLLKGDRSFNGAWNFGPHNNMMVTVDEIINKSKLIWNEIKFNITGKTEHHEANYLKLDIAKALELLAWKPIWNLEETLRYTIQWYKDFYNGQSNSTHILSSNNITKYVEDFNKTTKI